MIKFELHIKSHCEAPDCEMTEEAENKNEAARSFSIRIFKSSQGQALWPWRELIPYIKKVK